MPDSPARVPAGTRVYAIGDVHGCNGLLTDLLARITADTAARPAAHVVLVLLGDLVDRGPDSREVVEAAMTRPAFADELIVIRGNHEDIFLEAIDDPAKVWDGWLNFGGRATLASYGVSAQLVFKGAAALGRALQDEVPARHRAFLRGLPSSHRVGDYFFTHAGVRPGVALERQVDRDLLWIRDSFLKSPAWHGAVVVHGHTPVEAIEDLPNRIGIDTGAYQSGVLSAVGLEGTERWFLQTAPQPPH